MHTACKSLIRLLHINMIQRIIAFFFFFSRRGLLLTVGFLSQLVHLGTTVRICGTQ